MENVIGKILKGTVSGEDATFEVVAVKKDWSGEFFAHLDCVEFGCPITTFKVCDLDKPVIA